MLILWVVLMAVAVCFAGVLLVGAPYLPTLSKQVETALDIAEVTPGQTLIELGCGDGKVVIAAAQRGLNVVAYELNPVLVLIARLRTYKYRRTVQIIWGDFWRAELPKADLIFVFLLPRFMDKLDTKVMQYKHKPVKLVSFAFTIPDKKVVAMQDGVHVYSYR